jgi:hypothetical protein
MLPRLLPGGGRFIRVTDESGEREKVDRWLASTGFPLENAAVRTLENAGFTANAGVYCRPVD